MTSFSFKDCKIELLDKASQAGVKAYNQWQGRPGYKAVVDFVENFSHQYLFQITSEDIEKTINRSTHALGDVKSTEQLNYIEDFTTPFAFQHLFHWYIEQKQEVPTWSDFRNWMVDGPASIYWYHPLKKYLEENHTNHTPEQWSRAARWRLGKVYLSNMRELDLIIRLRERGLPVRYHLLADVLLRVDFWLQNILICTYFPNPQYRRGRQGRKPPASRFFPSPPFEIIDVEIERQGFGQFWLAKSSSIDSLANRLSHKAEQWAK